MMMNFGMFGNLPSTRQPERKNKNLPKALVSRLPLRGTEFPIAGIFMSYSFNNSVSTRHFKKLSRTEILIPKV